MKVEQDNEAKENTEKKNEVVFNGVGTENQFQLYFGEVQFSTLHDRAIRYQCVTASWNRIDRHGMGRVQFYLPIPVFGPSYAAQSILEIV